MDGLEPAAVFDCLVLENRHRRARFRELLEGLQEGWEGGIFLLDAALRSLRKMQFQFCRF